MRPSTEVPPPSLLPDAELIEHGLLGRLFRERGAVTFREAAEVIWRLPYGRNSNGSDYRLVLLEGRGTCSTKHALLRDLAQEQGLSVDLVLGFYLMSELNMPGTGPVLAAHGLTTILEAHCVLKHRGHSIDLTMPPGSPRGTPKRFVSWEFISAEQIPAYKTARHKLLLAEWASKLESRRLGLAEAWQIREACIAMLESGTPSAPHSAIFDPARKSKAPITSSLMEDGVE